MKTISVFWMCAALSAVACSGTSSSPVPTGSTPSTGIDTQSDPQNCGLPGHDCQGGTCRAGVCQALTLASGQTSAESIAVDATGVYWTTAGASPLAGTVMKAPLRGGSVTTLAGGQESPRGLVVDSTSAYWANAGTDLSGDGIGPVGGGQGMADGSVMKAPLAGGMATPVAQDQSSPGSVAVDGHSVYWTDFGAGTVQMTAIGGGPVFLLATGQDLPESLVVDATSVYWTNSGDGTVMKTTIAGPHVHDSSSGILPVGAVPVVVASGQDLPNGIAVDGGWLYWTNSGHIPSILAGKLPTGGKAPATLGWGSVMRVPVSGGTPTALATGQDRPVGIATDATNVYWTNFGDGTVMTVPKLGGEPITLATGQRTPHQIAVDGSSVYWTTYEGGTVVKLAKPMLLGGFSGCGVAGDGPSVAALSLGALVLALGLARRRAG